MTVQEKEQEEELKKQLSYLNSKLRTLKEKAETANCSMIFWK